MSIYPLARPETRDLVPYDAPPVPADFIRLNANESVSNPYTLPGKQSLNRYPEIRPGSIAKALADLYSLDIANVCPVRGSSEGIDLLIRAFCRPYRDNVVVLPPTFEMYQAYAKMQGAEIREVPLIADKDFAVDWQVLAKSCNENTKLIFLCSPNNPTGNLVAQTEIERFVKSRAGKSIVVVDEAYIEFSQAGSLAEKLGQYENLVVLRTLSKAYALAGARCGAVLGSAELLRIVSAMQSPYAISSPVAELVLRALDGKNQSAAEDNVNSIVAERDHLAGRLATEQQVVRVYPAAGNFLLVELTGDEALSGFRERRVKVREFTGVPGLERHIRISIGSRSDSDQVIAALATVSENDS